MTSSMFLSSLAGLVTACELFPTRADKSPNLEMVDSPALSAAVLQSGATFALKIELLPGNCFLPESLEKGEAIPLPPPGLYVSFDEASPLFVVLLACGGITRN